MRLAGYRPTVFGASYDNTQSQGINPFNPIPLRQRTKMDNLGGKIRNRTYQPVNFVPQNAQAAPFPAPQFAYLQPPPQQSVFDPINSGATFLFQ